MWKGFELSKSGLEFVRMRFQDLGSVLRTDRGDHRLQDVAAG